MNSGTISSMWWVTRMNAGACFFCQLTKVFEKSFSSDGIKAFARFVQDENGGFCHQRARDEDTLPFTLREHFPTAFDGLRDAQQCEEASGACSLRPAYRAPVADHCLLSSGDDL